MNPLRRSAALAGLVCALLVALVALLAHADAMPSPPPDASKVRRGLVNVGPGEQVFSGRKVFDGGVEVQGLLVADAGLIANAPILGLGGAVLVAPVTVDGGFTVQGMVVADAGAVLNNTLTVNGDAGVTGGLTVSKDIRTIYPAGFRGSSASGIVAVDDSLGLSLTYGNLIYIQDSSQWRFFSNITGSVRSIQAASGLEAVYGTDSSGTPGAATINKPRGISSVASGASSVVITNSLATTTSHIIITPYNRDTTCKEPAVTTRAAGSFTVSLSANCAATWVFAWEVGGLL